jgi:predicted DNA-binding protein (MmcQ/YjbR family)
MDLDNFRKYCLDKKGVTESQPFGDSVIVYKVMGKMFALANFEIPMNITLRCTPERSVELREEYEEIIPGYHMNKTNWNTITCSGKISAKLIKELTDLSYELIVAGLKKSDKEKLSI